jgi:aromatic ring-cleaving dioxygenase
MTWGAEHAGLDAIVIPLAWREELDHCQNKVFLNNDLEPLVTVLREAHAGTDRLLAQFNACIADQAAVEIP